MPASGLNRAFFSNSGTEAIEGALKLARAAGHATGGPDKNIVIALDNSFHGRTMGALALTGQPKYRKGFRAHAGGRALCSQATTSKPFAPPWTRRSAASCWSPSRARAASR